MTMINKQKALVTAGIFAGTYALHRILKALYRRGYVKATKVEPEDMRH